MGKLMNIREALSISSLDGGGGEHRASVIPVIMAYRCDKVIMLMHKVI